MKLAPEAFGPCNSIFVIGANERAVRLWLSLGFEIVGRLPQAFLHPKLGYVDALVMFRNL